MTRINLPTERRIGHLKVLRQGRKLTLKEYNALTLAEQLDMIRQARGKQKYDLILNAEKAEILTPQLHPQELYLTVNELGAEYAVELLMLASPEQITTLLDLDCWNDDSLSEVLSLHWLGLLLNTGEEKICQLVNHLEPELLALFLKKHLTIIRGLEAYDDDEMENAKRMESIYDIEYASEDAAKIIGALLQILLRKDQDSYLFLMEMIRSENFSILEEEVYQARNNRLLDIGFFPKNEAREIYTYLDPERFSVGGKKDFILESESLQHPGALLNYAEPRALLTEILSTGIDPALASELSMLANRKMSADSIDVASSEAVTEELQSVYDTLNLALEYLAGNDLSKAEKIFRSTYLLHLFQFGYSLIHQRQLSAKKIFTGPVGPLLDVPEQLFVESLLERPACIYHAACEDTPGQVKPLTTLKDLELADLKLAQLLSLQALFAEELPFTLVEMEYPDDQAPPLSTRFMTAVANQLLGNSLCLLPISAGNLPLLKNMTFREDKLHPEFQAEVHKLVTTLTENCHFFSKFCLECWLDDFIFYDPTQPGINFPECLIYDS